MLIMDLGSLDLVSTTSGLQLRLSSHVKVASSREDVKDLQNGLSIAAPTFYTERKHLVVAGNDIRLLVSLELDPSVHLDPESLLQAFGQKLYNAVVCALAATRRQTTDQRASYGTSSS